MMGEHLSHFDSLKLMCEKLTEQSEVAKLYLDNFDALYQAYTVLNDEGSKSVFVREVLFNILNNFADPQFAHEVGAHRTEQEVSKNLKKAYELDLVSLVGDSILQRNDTTVPLSLYSIFVDNQYLYKTENVCVAPEPGDICLDCGAWIGDTAVWFVKNCHVAQVISFDILEDNYPTFKETVAKLPLEMQPRIKFEKTGLAEKPSKKYFILNNGVLCATDSAMIYDYDRFVAKYGSDNVVEVNVTSIDEYCATNGLIPNFIKMDIEGAEESALLGAKNIIKNYKPKLAVCTYHRAKDLYLLPNIIYSINNSYRFYLRKVCRDYETVLYCI